MKISRLVPAFLCLLISSRAMSKPIRLENAKLETRPAPQGLEKTFQAIVAAQAQPAWVGYAVPLVPGRHDMCCYQSSGGSEWAYCGCHLEGDSGQALSAPSGAPPIRLEGPTQLLVLFRVEQKRVERIRTFSMDCRLDAGGLPFYYLADVRPAESVNLLAGFAGAVSDGTREGRRMNERALSAIALHADPAADSALERFVAAGQPESVRKAAAFWLGNARGRHGYEVLSRLAREDSSANLRESAVFALSRSREPEAVDVVVSVARHDSDPHVRGQALFWLAQMAGKRASNTISEAVVSDPETSVKKKAVFALSRLPKDEGVPLLIQTARTNTSLVVRKEAMRWLGRSKDPRAIAFFEEVLKK